MAHKIHRFKGFVIENENVDIRLDMKRIEDNYNAAQYALDSAVMTSMEPFMPMGTGQFINVTKAMSAARAGLGEVIAAAPPQGHFLYEGKVMIGEKSQSPWARKGEKKVVTDKNLRYSRTGAHSKWFDAAKKKDCDSWVNTVRNIAGGGK